MNDHIATGEALQNLIEVQDAITEAVSVATSKNDPTCRVIRAILLSIQSAISGGGIGDWVQFSQQFGEKMLPIWEGQLAAQNN